MKKKQIKEIKEFFSQLVKIMEEKALYADCLYTAVSDRTINKDKTIIDIHDDADIGVKLRVFDGEKFLEKGISGFNKTSLKKAAEELRDSVMSNKETVKLIKDTSIFENDFEQKGTIDQHAIRINEKVAFVNKLQQQIMAFDKRIINTRVLYEEGIEIKIFVNNKKKLSQIINSCFILVLPFVQTAEGETRYYYKAYFKPGYEATDISEQDINDVCTMALRIIDAKRIQPGRYTCLLTPPVTGLLAHESFGHGMEADTMFKGRAMASQYLGRKIAPDYVSIVDNPSFSGKNGSFFFDDEGQITDQTFLVKEGLVNRPITDLYSASRSNFLRSGNARAESYDHKVFARMSNTYFMPGNDDPRKMLESIDDGYYLHYSTGGMEDPKGWGTQIQGILAERVIHGRLTGELFFEVGMTGFLPTILSNIMMVGNELILPGCGRCGKGHKEWVRVCEGGPHLLIKELHLS
ncbi:TldD/PmbA family protein [Candidatus Woesearchaeota archaeon]|nr:TldD/PmbA family protein [Candidatus Woesearchaeota archaeon]